jgi:ligand-binding SRPBCC domain-containing protein
MVYRLERATFIPKPKAEVFRFFSDAHNLERITPAFLRFHILTPGPIEMKAGTLIEYQLRLHGIPVRWKTRIAEFVPDDYFVDVQLSGPYRSWRHRHDFMEAPGGTEMRDHVEYEMPFGVVGTIVHQFFVRRSVNNIFDHRNATIAQYFG